MEGVFEERQLGQPGTIGGGHRADNSAGLFGKGLLGGWKIGGREDIDGEEGGEGSGFEENQGEKWLVRGGGKRIG